MNYRRNEDYLGCTTSNPPAYSGIISCEFSNEGAVYDAVEQFYYYTATGTEGRSWIMPELAGFFINGRIYRDGMENDPSGTQTMNREAIDIPAAGQYQWLIETGRITLSDADPMPSANERFTIPFAASTVYYEPVTLQEAKLYLRIDASETAFDNDIKEAITAARQEIETYLNRSLINRTVTAVMNVAGGRVSLPYGPVASLLALTDTHNAIERSNYTLNEPVLFVDGYDRILCIYDAGGYTALRQVPAPFKLGIKRLVAYDWENRGDTGKERKLSAITGLAKYRRVV